VRASYADETQEQIDGLSKTLHFRKIGVIYPDDAFGGAVLLGVQGALQKENTAPVATASNARRTSLTEAAINKVGAANPDAVIVVGPSNTVAPLVKRGPCPGMEAAVCHCVVRGHG
jgi:branched-chain amino acid transport system substrate-binding protein